MIARTRVLVVDDSPSVCRLLTAHLASAADLLVLGSAHSGERAVELVNELRPDVVTLDLDMPGIGGLGALDRIMATCPTPVVLLSGVGRKAADAVAAGLSLGAVDHLPKYTPGKDVDPNELKGALLTKVRTAARVKVIRSLRGGAPVGRAVRPLADRIIVIGASTGGPAAIRTLLSAARIDRHAAVVIVQHMPPAWTEPLAGLLARHLGRDVRQAMDGDRLTPGAMLVAPGDHHLTVRSGGFVTLAGTPKVHGHRPSIDVAMESVAAVYGPRGVGVLLTGMGEDGARGLLAVRRAGGRTFAQDGPSCAVFGMPRRAIDLGAADEIDTPAGIAARLAKTVVGD